MGQYGKVKMTIFRKGVDYSLRSKRNPFVLPEGQYLPIQFGSVNLRCSLDTPHSVSMTTNLTCRYEARPKAAAE